MDGTGYGPAPLTDELIRSLFDQHLELIQHLGKICENEIKRIELLEKRIDILTAACTKLASAVTTLESRVLHGYY